MQASSRVRSNVRVKGSNARAKNKSNMVSNEKIECEIKNLRLVVLKIEGISVHVRLRNHSLERSAEIIT
jgi:hypothetical protein